MCWILWLMYHLYTPIPESLNSENTLYKSELIFVKAFFFSSSFHCCCVFWHFVGKKKFQKKKIQPKNVHTIFLSFSQQTRGRATKSINISTHNIRIHQHTYALNFNVCSLTLSLFFSIGNRLHITICRTISNSERFHFTAPQTLSNRI